MILPVIEMIPDMDSPIKECQKHNALHNFNIGLGFEQDFIKNNEGKANLLSPFPYQ